MPKQISTNLAIVIALIAFALGAGVGVLAWIQVSGGSGEASQSASERAPQLSLSDSTPASEATTVPTEAPAEATTAPTEAPAEATPASEAAVPAEAQRLLFRIQPEGSEARFLIDEDLRGQRITVVGKTNQVGGDIIVDFANPQNSEVGVIVINARTLETDNNFRNQALRGQILRSATPAYEFIEFTPSSLEGLPTSAAEGESLSFRVTGDLKIIEVVRPVTFEVTLNVQDGVMTGSAKTTVLYKDFNITIPQVPSVANISDEVGLEFDFSAQLVDAQ